MTEVASFADIEAEFMERVGKMVWCNMATVDPRGRPRSRIVHPIWEGTTGWIGTRRHSFKDKQLAANPHVSLGYVSDVAKPVYAECLAEWVDDLVGKQRAWDHFLATPPPLGYDPAPIFKAVDDPDFGVLKLTPWRIALVNFPEPSRVWRPA
jgi:general stress protein 26